MSSSSFKFPAMYSSDNLGILSRPIKPESAKKGIQNFNLKLNLDNSSLGDTSLSLVMTYISLHGEELKSRLMCRRIISENADIRNPYAS